MHPAMVSAMAVASAAALLYAARPRVEPISLGTQRRINSASVQADPARRRGVLGGMVRLFSTCPQSTAVDRARFVDEVIRVSRWSDAGGCSAMLVYTDNSLVDPWLIAHLVLQHTTDLAPLVAVQPLYMHPFTVANMVSTFAHLYGRRVFLNMVAGGFALDLKALGDVTEHDDRYKRIIEYTTIVMRLLQGDGAVTYHGDFYQVANLRLRNPIPPALMPGLTVSGSSLAGAAAARALGATAIQYPQPPHAYDTEHHDILADQGVRIGIIARETDAEAWAVAHARFPGDRHGQLTHRLAMAVSDSEWHRQLSVLADESSVGRSPYWLHPFQNYKTFCPYLVGSYDAVAVELAGYIRRGFSTFVLDIPRAADEFDHVRRALQNADAVLAA